MGFQRIDHFELVVSDIDRALTFYQSLGVASEQATFPGQDKLRTFLNIGGSQQVNVVTPRDVAALGRTASPGGGHFCMVWDGPVDEVVADFSRRGLVPRRGPGKGRGARGDGISLFINDPDSNSIEIIVYSTQTCS